MKTRRERKESARAEEGKLSRREFARGATVAAAALAALPATAGEVLTEAALAAHHGSKLPLPSQGGQGENPKLSAEGQAEVEAKIAEIMRRYGERLNDEQKADIRRLVREAQAPVESLRAYPLENSDEPATVLHLVRAEEGAHHAPARRGAGERSKRPGV